MKSQAKYALLPSYDDVARSTIAKKAKMPDWLIAITTTPASLKYGVMLCFFFIGIYMLTQKLWLNALTLFAIVAAGCHGYTQSQPLLYTLTVLLASDTCAYAYWPPSVPWYASGLIAACHAPLMLKLLAWIGKLQERQLQQESAASRAALAAVPNVAPGNSVELTSLSPAAGNADLIAEQVGDLLSEEEEQQQVESSIGGGAID